MVNFMLGITAMSVEGLYEDLYFALCFYGFFIPFLYHFYTVCTVLLSDIVVKKEESIHHVFICN